MNNATSPVFMSVHFHTVTCANECSLFDLCTHILKPQVHEASVLETNMAVTVCTEGESVIVPESSEPDIVSVFSSVSVSCILPSDCLSISNGVFVPGCTSVPACASTSADVAVSDDVATLVSGIVVISDDVATSFSGIAVVSDDVATSVSGVVVVFDDVATPVSGIVVVSDNVAAFVDNVVSGGVAASRGVPISGGLAFFMTKIVGAL